MPYRHFTREDRVELRGLLRTDLSQNEVARSLGRDSGSVSREVAKGGGRKGYSVAAAESLTAARRGDANQQHRKLGVDAELTGLVADLLALEWSPEQIAGRMRFEGRAKVTSFSAIYEYANPRAELAGLLPRKHSKYRRRHGISDREKKRAEMSSKRPLSERPPEVAARERLGDWEGDTIVGGEKRERILTHTDRKSGYLLASKTCDGTAAEIRRRTERDFRAVPKDRRLTRTLDNGTEFAEWELTEGHTGMTTYFAAPYHSWERGTSENTNGLLRRPFPKGTPFATLTPKRLEGAVYRLNHRPRKRLGWKTPHEVFHGVEVLQFDR